MPPTRWITPATTGRAIARGARRWAITTATAAATPHGMPRTPRLGAVKQPYKVLEAQGGSTVLPPTEGGAVTPKRRDGQGHAVLHGDAGQARGPGASGR